MHDAHELANIARVQTDARFIHDKKGVDERRAKTCRQVHALHFTTAQRPRGTIEREITDANFAKIIQARTDFISQHLSGRVAR